MTDVAETHVEKYPMHVKLKAIVDQSNSVGDFIEWLDQHGYRICEERKANSDAAASETIHVSPHSHGARGLGEAFVEVLNAIADSACIYWPTSKRLPNDLLAEYFKIDQQVLEREKQAMLDELRAMPKEYLPEPEKT